MTAIGLQRTVDIDAGHEFRDGPNPRLSWEAHFCVIIADSIGLELDY